METLKTSNETHSKETRGTRFWLVRKPDHTSQMKDKTKFYLLKDDDEMKEDSKHKEYTGTQYENRYLHKAMGTRVTTSSKLFKMNAAHTSVLLQATNGTKTTKFSG